MRCLAIDIGSKRIGLAISDSTGSVASPLKVLPASEVFSQAPSFRRILSDYQPELLVFGLPASLDGSEGAQAALVRSQAEKVAAACGLPHVFSDERLSSIEAKRILRESGYNERSMRGKTDTIAASIFLQAYLDSRRAAGSGGDVKDSQGHD
jgi:putative Holliday junction resolvase